MNWYFIVSLLFALLALIFSVKAVFSGGDDRFKAAGTGTVFVILFVLGMLVAAGWTVPARNVGIVTQGNKAVTHKVDGKEVNRTTGAGWHWTKPWQKIEDWDASRQSYDHLGGPGNKENSCVSTVITGMDTACVEVLVEWETKAENAYEQWASYKKDFDFFKSRRVEPNIKDAVSAVFRSHDPTKNVDTSSADAAIVPVAMKDFKQPLMNEISSRIGADIKVLAVTFGRIHYSENTQKTIDAFRAKVMEARNLAQDERNADTRKRITEKNSTRDKQAWCLEIAESKGKEPGFCLGGGNPTQVTGGR